MAINRHYVLVNYGISIEIDTTPDAENPTWALLADGISNITEAMNEVKQQTYYLADKGYGHTEVTAQHPAFTLTGNRVYGDAAQDYVFGLKYALGCHRKTQLRISVMNTCDSRTLYTRYIAQCTVCDLQEISGSAENLCDISITLEFNGRPEFDPATPTLTVTGDGTASVSITMATATTGATIHYTTDGTTPTAASAAYSSAVTLTTAGTHTIQAIAIHDGLKSEIASTQVTVAS